MKPRLRVFILFALILFAASPSIASAQEGGGGPIYVVQEGDTLTAIALRFGTTVDALVQTNGISDPAAIQPGLRLVLPGFEGVTGVLTFHEVAFGESIDSLAASYRLTPSALAKLNRWVNPSEVYVGEPAIVPEPESGGRAQGTTLFLAAGEGLLEAAVRTGTDPWLLTGPDGALWEAPGEPIYLTGGDGFPSDLPPGLQSVTLDPLPVVQGHTAVLSALADPGTTLAGEFAGHTLNLILADPQKAGWVALQGLYALQPPGLVDLELRVTADGVDRAYRQPVRMVDGGFGREAVQGVPAETLDPANTVPEDEHVAEIVAPVTSDRLWSGVFQFPTDYFDTFPSRFGTRRSYNGSDYIYYHTGLDLYGNPKTEIHAVAPGRVVFAGPLAVRGNATYIDHGWGVYTGYLHQSQIFVHPGDIVQSGDTIGMVGATGRVTGAHLHWEVWVGGVPVEPLEWTVRVMP